MAKLLATIQGWQDRASAISPPPPLERATGRLRGRAFFPHGVGLELDDKGKEPAWWPDILVLGHNFGKRSYYEDIRRNPRESEDKEPTWRNLALLLRDIKHPGSGMDLIRHCFMTNWYIGFGPTQRGSFFEPCKPPCALPSDCIRCRYANDCLDLLRAQIRALAPRVILVLGQAVIVRAHLLAPDNIALRRWRDIKGVFRDVDAGGPVAFDVEIPECGEKTNIVALTHPCEPISLAYRGNPHHGRPQGSEFHRRREIGKAFEIGIIKQSLLGLS